MTLFTKKIRQMLLGVLATFALSSAQASHIDELFVNITADSSDGAGNFILRYDQYLGSDGSGWTGSAWSGWGATYSTSIGISLTSGPGSLSGSTAVNAVFQGLVDSSGAATAGFGASQFNMQFVNDSTDASLWTDYLSFSIAGFDSSATYLVNVTANDCCVVSGSTPTFNGTLQFDPRQVFNGSVPEPTILALFGFGIAGMGYYRRRKSTI